MTSQQSELKRGQHFPSDGDKVKAVRLDFKSSSQPSSRENSLTRDASRVSLRPVTYLPTHFGVLTEVKTVLGLFKGHKYAPISEDDDYTDYVGMCCKMYKSGKLAITQGNLEFNKKTLHSGISAIRAALDSVSKTSPNDLLGPLKREFTLACAIAELFVVLGEFQGFWVKKDKFQEKLASLEAAKVVVSPPNCEIEHSGVSDTVVVQPVLPILKPVLKITLKEPILTCTPTPSPSEVKTDDILKVTLTEPILTCTPTSGPSKVITDANNWGDDADSRDNVEAMDEAEVSLSLEGVEANGVLDLDNYRLDEEEFSNKDFQFNERAHKQVLAHCNKARENLIKRLQAQHKGSKTTCLLISRSMENMASKSMADNAFASLLKAGFSDQDFCVGEANVSYLSIVTFKDTAALDAALSREKIDHMRVGALGKCSVWGQLFFKDLRVNREELVVTGVDMESWGLAKDALITKFKEWYPLVQISAKKGSREIKLDLGDGVKSFRRETPDIILNISSPADVSYNYFTGPWLLQIAPGIKRDVEIKSTTWTGKCRVCGSGGDACRRQIDGVDGFRWACKSKCFHCHAPSQGHDEVACGLKGHAANRMSKKVNQAWQMSCQSLVKKTQDLDSAMAQGLYDNESTWQAAGVKRFESQYSKLSVVAQEAATKKETPYTSPFLVRGAKLRQLRSNELAADKSSGDQVRKQKIINVSYSAMAAKGPGVSEGSPALRVEPLFRFPAPPKKPKVPGSKAGGQEPKLHRTSQGDKLQPGAGLSL